MAGAPLPDGFDPRTVRAAAAALLRKRASGVATDWPLLAAGLGGTFPAVFVDWAAGRPPEGGLRDGWDFARWLHGSRRLPQLAAIELAGREALLRYDGHRPPRRRRLPRLVRIGGTPVLGLVGRAYRLRW